MEKEFNDLVELLKKERIHFRLSEHPAVRTSEEAAAVRNVELKTGVKALVFEAKRDSNKDLVLVLVRGDHKVDSKKLADVLGVKNTKLAPPEEVLERTGCETGSVHPFGNLFGLAVYMDKAILEIKDVNFSAGLHHKSINMKSDDMLRIIKPELVDISLKK